jgi:hypothetical protein
MSEASAPVGAPRTRAGLSIQSILLIMLLLVSITSNLVVGVLGYLNGNDSLRSAAIDKVVEVRDSRARDLPAVRDHRELASRSLARRERDGGL